MPEAVPTKPTDTPSGVEAPSRAGLRMGAPCSPASSFLRGERFGRTDNEKGADAAPGTSTVSAPGPTFLAAVDAIVRRTEQPW